MRKHHVGASFAALLCLQTEAHAEDAESNLDQLNADLATTSLITTLKSERGRATAVSVRGGILGAASYISDTTSGGDDAAKANLKLSANLFLTAATAGASVPLQMAAGVAVDMTVDHLYDMYVVKPRELANWNAFLDKIDADSEADTKARLDQYAREGAESLSRYPRDPDVGKVTPPVVGSGSFSAVDTSGVNAGRARETLGAGTGEECDDMAWYRGECTKGDRAAEPETPQTELKYETWRAESEYAPAECEHLGSSLDQIATAYLGEPSEYCTPYETARSGNTITFSSSCKAFEGITNAFTGQARHVLQWQLVNETTLEFSNMITSSNGTDGFKVIYRACVDEPKTDCSPEGQAAWRAENGPGPVNYACETPLQ